MNKRVFGKYSYKDNYLYRLDARIKLIALILFTVICFLNYGNYFNNFIVLGIIIVLIAILFITSKTSFIELLKNLKSLWMMLIILTIINCLIPFGSATHILYEFPNGFKIYWESIFNSIRVTIRIALMIGVTLTFTSSTSPLDITYAFEWFFSFLRIFKIPTQIISMTMSLALRFIPTLLEETDRIMSAQKSRGVDYQKGFLVKKVKAISTLIVPLLVSCFLRSDELAIAMDARGYDPYAERSHYRSFKFSRRDFVSIIVVSLLTISFITLSVFVNFFNFNLVETIFKITGTF